MYELYFLDMRKHGKIIFKNHEEYNWLKWDEDISVYFDYENRESQAYEGAIFGGICAFDINNDGKTETVLFERTSLGGYLFDNLKFFPFEYYQKFKTKINTKEYPQGYPSFPPPNSHLLKELPVQMVTDSLGVKHENRLHLGTYSYIRPLKIGSQYFLSIFGSLWEGLPYPPLDQTNFIAVSQYGPNNQLEDVCYFMRAYHGNMERFLGSIKRKEINNGIARYSHRLDRDSYAGCPRGVLALLL
jgi:hypothetical protein